jgi:hypothetical protein
MIGILALATVFFGLVTYVPPMTLIILLNGLFIGAVASVFVAYHELILGSIFGVEKYNRVQQMTVSFFVMWSVLAFSACLSAYNRSIDWPLAVPTGTVALRYLSIIAAILQVTAPDFGLGLFHGRDRKMLWVASLTGIIVAIAAIFFQDRNLLF